ncbi:hypothetical protein KM031_21595 (plasmid) [Gemmobacter fulvus]|uniref:Uncharacterized protein n=1 Tax=Gemmobacter fulvus TaxID=2840474 RepID=A0A975S3A7_9RHOB|nr:hypothetical protein [Gemmobacter fulvus]MBT9247964.1 hypothetical protein [Gemmobacter fulvus]QWK93019.1 hypothetical protein KM031_21595 [Gemmobacter fulvus]
MTVPVKPVDRTPRLGPAPERIGSVGAAQKTPDVLAKGPKPVFWVLRRLVILAGGTVLLALVFTATKSDIAAFGFLLFPLVYSGLIARDGSRLFGWKHDDSRISKLNEEMWDYDRRRRHAESVWIK